MNAVLSFIGPLAYILVLSSGIALLLKRRIEQALPLSFFFSAVFLYVFALLNALEVGYFLVVAATIAIAALAVVRTCKKGGQLDRKSSRQARRQSNPQPNRKSNSQSIGETCKTLLVTPGLAIFLLIYLFVFLITLNKGFLYWDEVSHWGPMVKETLYTGVLYSDTTYLNIHRDYPPAICLLQCLWCKLSGGVYAEPLLYRALWTMCLSLFLPFTRKLEWERSVFSIVRLLFVVLFIIGLNAAIPVSEASFFQSIYTDCALALLFAYGAVSIALDDLSEWQTSVSLYLFAVFFSLTKQMGVALTFLLLLLYLFKVVYVTVRSNKQGAKAKAKANANAKANALRFVVALVVSASAPLFSYLSWKVHVSMVGAAEDAQFSLSSIDPSMVFGVLNGTAGEEWQHVAAVKYLYELVSGNNLFLGLSYVFACILAIALLVAVLLTTKDALSLGEKSALVLFFTGASIAYALGIGLLYAFSFGPVEGPALASYPRYMGTMVYAILAAAAMLLLHSESSRPCRECYALYVTCIIVLLLTPIASWKTILKPMYSKPSAPITEAFEKTAETISDNTAEGSSVFVVSHNQETLFNNYKIGYLVDARTLNEGHLWLGANPAAEYYIYVSPDELGDSLEGFDYLYFQDAGNWFTEEGYAQVVGIDGKVGDGQLYELERTQDGSIHATLIAKG